MRVSRIYRGKKSNRINIDLDEEFGFSVEEASLTKFNLYTGKDITKDEVEQIIEQDKKEYLYNKAIEYLARRPRSKDEMYSYLEEKASRRYKRKFENAIQKSIEALEKRGYLNDAEFAEWYGNTRLNQKKYSIYQIRSELGSKFGVDKRTCDQVLEKLDAQKRELEGIANLVNKKYGQYKAKYKDKKTAKDKMVGYLSAKGFKWDQIKKVLSTEE
ncbi:hypothetical protein GF389_02500 [Candidatus Dojkabacteria bacterium]|nr:hypothetical protein [Candidatus Dojkabacteria bacterium]